MRGNDFGKDTAISKQMNSAKQKIKEEIHMYIYIYVYIYIYTHTQPY